MAYWSYDQQFRLTSPFGYRIHPITNIKTFHRGVDLVISPSNGILKAFVAGEVMFARHGMAGIGMPVEMGNVVAIRDNKGFLHVYAHLSAILVKVGQYVSRGEEIGRQGTTGASTGNHLHYEIRRKSSPVFGWEKSNDCVVEPTSYLFDYYKEIGDEPMTKEEKQAFDELVKAVNSQNEIIKKVEAENEKLKNEVQALKDRAKMKEIPDFAKKAVATAVEKKLVDTPDGGSYDFYRTVTILHRGNFI